MHPHPARLLLVVALAVLGGSALDAVLNLGDTFVGEICEPTEIDHVRYEAFAGTVVTLDLTAPAPFRPRFTVTNLSTGQIVGGGVVDGSGTAQAILGMPSTGLYDVRLTSSDGSIGEYTLVTDKRLPDRRMKIDKTVFVSGGEVLDSRFDALNGFLLNADIRAAAGSDAALANARVIGPAGPLSLTGFVIPVTNAVVIRNLPLGITTLSSFNIEVDNIGDDGLVLSKLRLVEGIPPATVFEEDDCATFGPAQVIWNEVGLIRIEELDSDGDGDTDLVALDQFEDNPTLLVNSLGDGSSFLRRSLLGTGTGMSSIATGDVNGDGHDEVFGTWNGGGSTPRVGYYLNNGTGVTNPYGGLTVLTASLELGNHVAVGDVDDDGDTDIVVSTSSPFFGLDRISWYENLDGLGAFGPEQIVDGTSPGTGTLVVADVDGDGDGDVLRTSLTDETISLYRYDGATDVFGAEEILATGLALVRSLAVDDVDLDGDPDVAFASVFSDTVAYLENRDGLGTFSPVPQVIDDTLDGARVVRLADIDGDGRLDVMAGGLLSDEIVWYRRLPGGGYDVPLLVTEEADSIRDLALADLDGDGDPDPASANFNGPGVAWYENTVNEGTLLLVVGDGPGATWVSLGERVLGSDVGGVRHTRPLRGLGPVTIPLPAPGAGATPGSVPTWTADGTFVVQVVGVPLVGDLAPGGGAFDPDAYRDLASNLVAVHVQPDGTVETVGVGEADGLTLDARAVVDEAGRPQLEIRWEAVPRTP